MVRILTILIGLGLAWLIGTDVSDVPLAQLTVGMIFRNLLALYVFYVFFMAALEFDE